jgi:hypothetical protein
MWNMASSFCGDANLRRRGGNEGEAHALQHIAAALAPAPKLCAALKIDLIGKVNQPFRKELCWQQHIYRPRQTEGCTS